MHRARRTPVFNGREFTKMATRRQHVVPQFYLSGFSREGKAWASRKGERGAFGRPFTTDIKNLCSIRDYYEVKGTHGQAGSFRRNDIESWLSSLENQLATPLRNVREARSTDSLQITVRNSLYAMKILLANLIMRNPLVLNPPRQTSEQFSNALIAEGFITDEELEELDKLGVTPRDVTEFAILRMELQTKVEGSSMSDILSWLDGTGVLVLRARVGSQFVTADVPFAIGWEKAESELPIHIYLPLDWRTAIVFHKYDQNLASRYADIPEVDFWNHVLMTRNEPLTTAIAKCEGALRRVTERYNTNNRTE